MAIGCSEEMRCKNLIKRFNKKGQLRADSAVKFIISPLNSIMPLVWGKSLPISSHIKVKFLTFKIFLLQSLTSAFNPCSSP